MIKILDPFSHIRDTILCTLYAEQEFDDFMRKLCAAGMVFTSKRIVSSMSPKWRKQRKSNGTTKSKFHWASANIHAGVV